MLVLGQVKFICIIVYSSHLLFIFHQRFCYLIVIVFLTAGRMALDLVILAGSSSSKMFADQQQFVISLLDKIKISSDSTLLGAVTYGRPPQVQWKIGDKLNKDATKRAMLAMTNPGINGGIYEALRFINTTLFNANQGARPNTQKAILMFAGDNPIGDKLKMVALARSLKERRVKLVVVNLGRKDDKQTLRPFAYDQYSYFAPPNLEELKRVLTPVTSAVQPGLILFSILENIFYDISVLYSALEFSLYIVIQSFYIKCLEIETAYCFYPLIRVVSMSSLLGRAFQCS